MHRDSKMSPDLATRRMKTRCVRDDDKLRISLIGGRISTTVMKEKQQARDDVEDVAADQLPPFFSRQRGTLAAGIAQPRTIAPPPASKRRGLAPAAMAAEGFGGPRSGTYALIPS